MHSGPNKRVLILGWDAADWKMIDPLLASGAMPNLQRLITRGVRADLASLDPKLSPILWTSIATGKTADKHGILNFIEPDPAGGGVRITASTSRKTKALWNILSQSDRRSIVVNWYASHPAEPIRGVCVSNAFQEGPPKTPREQWVVAPAAVSSANAVAAVQASRVHPSTVALHDLRVLLPRSDALAHDDHRIALMRKLLAQCRSVHNVALSLLATEQPWDCTMAFYDMIDVAGHHFMQYHAPRMDHVSKRDFAALSGVMNGVYRLHDRMLGEIPAAAGDDTTVLLLSDHGFHSDHLRPKTVTAVHDEHAAMDATWHRQTGVLVMSGPGIRQGASVHSASLLDITPTILTLMGLPVGEDMDGRVLLEALDDRSPVSRIASWDSVEGDAGQHPPELQVDPFESQDALKQLADLGYIQPVGEDVEQALRNIDRETRSNLGVVYLTTRRPHRALPIFERLHAEYPADGRFALNLAHCQHACGRSEQAEQTLRGFQQSNTDSPEMSTLRATVLNSQGRFIDAADVLKGALRTRPNDLSLWIALAESQRLAGAGADAEASLAHAIRLDPRHATSHHQRSLLALAQGRFEAAAEHALTALEIRHAMPEAHYALGLALAWLEDLEHARQSFLIALSLQPGMIDAHRYVAHISRALHDLESASRHQAEADRLRSLVGREGGSVAGHDPLGPDAWAGRSTPAPTSS